jgi:Tfp pilus assembly protein PilO
MNFTRKERAFFIFLLVLLVGLAYYQFVDRPVRKSLEIYAVQEDDLSLELTEVQAKLVTMRKMRDEMVDIGQGLKEMGSYNNSKVEIEILNNIPNHQFCYFHDQYFLPPCL